VISALWHPLRRWRWRRAARRAGRGWPPPERTVSDAALLAIDLEMTGLDPARDEIISIGWVPIDAGAIDLSGAREFRLSRRRGHSVGDSATIHGLRDCDLDDAEATGPVLARMLEALDGRVAVFHHAPLDLAFLRRALRRHLDSAWPAPVIDTLAWHRRRARLAAGEPAAPGTATLEAAVRHYGLTARSQHDALGDALSCAELALVLAGSSQARLVEIAEPPAPGRAGRA